MKMRIVLAASTLSVFAMLACSVPNSSQDQVREKTAEATAAVKRDTRAMAQGVREGWNRDKTLDVNSATREQLETLPGIDAAKARLIEEHRPYPTPNALVTKKVLSKAEFDRIAGKVQAR